MLSGALFNFIGREEGKDIWPTIAYTITITIVVLWALLLYIFLNRDETFYKEIEEETGMKVEK